MDNTHTAPLSASQEDYLEAIFHIVKENQVARVRDISKRLNVKSPSVTGALQSLSERDLINYAPYDLITMKPKGVSLAKNIVRRHNALRDFFVKVLMVTEDDAEEGACKMEHVVSREILDQLIRFIDFVENTGNGSSSWSDAFQEYCSHEGER